MKFKVGDTIWLKQDSSFPLWPKKLRVLDVIGDDYILEGIVSRCYSRSVDDNYENHINISLTSVLEFSRG